MPDRHIGERGLNGQDLMAPVDRTTSLVWKIYIHFVGHPRTLMRRTRRIAVPSLRITKSNLAHKKSCQICWVCLRKIYCLTLLGSWTFLLTFFYQIFWFCLYLWFALLFCWPWPSFTSDVRQDSLVRWEFCGPDAPSLAQAVLHRTPSKFSM